MDPHPHLDELQRDLLSDLTTLTERTLARGLSERTLAYVLLEMSKEAAMQGDPVTLYDHTLLMETRGRELRAEFEARFGDSLDLEALSRGEIVAKH
ncbi:MAG: hypothetical protein AAF368_15750 [Planctomycetota bacterium]